MLKKKLLFIHFPAANPTTLLSMTQSIPIILKMFWGYSIKTVKQAINTLQVMDRYRKEVMHAVSKKRFSIFMIQNIRQGCKNLL